MAELTQFKQEASVAHAAKIRARAPEARRVADKITEKQKSDGSLATLESAAHPPIDRTKVARRTEQLHGVQKTDAEDEANLLIRYLEEPETLLTGPGSQREQLQNKVESYLSLNPEIQRYIQSLNPTQREQYLDSHLDDNNLRLEIRKSFDAWLNGSIDETPLQTLDADIQRLTIEHQTALNEFTRVDTRLTVVQDALDDYKPGNKLDRELSKLQKQEGALTETEDILTAEQRRLSDHLAAVEKAVLGLQRDKKSVPSGLMTELSTTRTTLETCESNQRTNRQQLQRLKQLREEREALQREEETLITDKGKKEATVVGKKAELDRATTKQTHAARDRKIEEGNVTYTVESVVSQATQKYLETSVQQANQKVDEVIEALQTHDRTENQIKVQTYIQNRWRMAPQTFHKWGILGGREYQYYPPDVTNINGDYNQLFTVGPDELFRQMLTASGVTSPPGQAEFQQFVEDQGLRDTQNQMTRQLLTKQMLNGGIPTQELDNLYATTWGKNTVTEAMAESNLLKQQRDELRKQGLSADQIGTRLWYMVKSNPKLMMGVLGFGVAAVALFGVAA